MIYDSEKQKNELLIYHNTSSTADYSGQYYSDASYGQQQYPSQAYADMLLEEAEKLYNKLAKEIGDEIFSDYASSTSSSSLPLLPPPEERQTHPATASNQTHMHTEEHRFTQSEINGLRWEQISFYGLKVT